MRLRLHLHGGFEVKILIVGLGGTEVPFARTGLIGIKKIGDSAIGKISDFL